VYFADSPYKAIQYCGDSKFAVMLLCEVALGVVSKLQIDNLVYSNIKVRPHDLNPRLTRCYIIGGT
jgi:hypothetical protein